MLLDAGKTVIQETRLWNENRDQTEPMRTKENAQDYRYFPEPDLPVFVPDAAFLQLVEDSICELPLARAKRFISDYGVTAEQAGLLCEEQELARFYEDTVKAAAAAKAAGTGELAAKTAALLLGDVKHLLTREGIDAAHIGTAKLTPSRLASLVTLTARGAVSAKNAKQALQAVFTEDKDPEDIISEHGWEQLTDPAAIANAVDGTLAAEAATAAELREAKAAGNEKRIKTLTSYLAGKVIAATGGRADPSIVGKALAEKLG